MGKRHDWTFGVSHNHWSNEQEKKNLIKRVIKEWVQAGAMTEENAKNIPLVLLLDCRNVNLKASLREWVKQEYPFIRLRFIPAGLTGKVQNNDTYFHAPFKMWVAHLSHVWYNEHLLRLLKSLEDGAITQGDMDIRLQELMRIDVLRDAMLDWHDKALDKLVDEGLIKKGWTHAYDQMFLADFQADCRERREAIRAQEAEVEAAVIAHAEAVVHNPVEVPPMVKYDGIVRDRAREVNAAAQAAADDSLPHSGGDCALHPGHCEWRGRQAGRRGRGP